MVEGAGAAGLAAILAQPGAVPRAARSAPILCGGNIDTHLLANVLVRDLVRCGRIARLRIAAQDRPGALAAITAKFHECGVNIIEINHHRIFTRLPAKDTVIEVECEARDAEAIDRWSSGSKTPASTSSAPSSTSASAQISSPCGTVGRVNPLFRGLTPFHPRLPSRIKSFVTICGGRSG